ncbi:MAG TPA: hypothetical protein VNV66_14325, partial [Pilimelia sp.]|nr:hypothetical protein [Pilimelia sp.]
MDMLRWHVERPGRAAARPVHPPTGRSPRRLPSLQTPASRTGLGCDRAGVRLGLRTLVLAGFATAAWLLSASAAQAAEEPAVDPFPASVGAVTAAVQPVPGLAPTLLSDAASSSTEATSAAPSSGPVGPPASSGVLATRPGVVAVPAA